MRKLALILTLLVPVFVTLKAMPNNRISVMSSMTTNGYCMGFGRSIIRVGPPTVIHPNDPHHVG